MACGSLFQIKRYFCCWTLKTGSFIVGYLGLLSHLLQTAAVSSRIYNIQNTLVPIVFQITGNNTVLTLGVYKVISIYSEFMAIITAYHVLSVILQLALVWGLHKSSRDFFLPWLVVQGFKNVCIVVGGIVLAILHMTILYKSVGYLFLIIGVFALYSWFVTYSYMCVYSHYLDLKDITPEFQMVKDVEKDFPPTYIRSLSDDKKQDI